MSAIKGVLLGIIFLLFATVLIPPVFGLFNRLDPWVLGMPFLQFWLLVVNFGSCVCLTIMWKLEEQGGMRK